MIFITILIVVVSILLGLIVLIQNPKGGGLGSGFGNVNQIGGVQRTADFLEKATWGLAIALVVLCMASAGFNSSVNADADSSLPGDAELYQPPAPATGDDAASEDLGQ
jgi:preprotein translocase subunit SecG